MDDVTLADVAFGLTDVVMSDPSTLTWMIKFPALVEVPDTEIKYNPVTGAV